MEEIDTDEQPSKNSCVFIDYKQSNDPCKTKEREDDDESLDEIPACAQVQSTVFAILHYTHIQ